MKTKGFIIITFTLIMPFLKAQDSLQLSIEEALTYSKTHNLDKQVALLEIDIAEKKVKEIIGIGLPQVSASGSYTNNLKLPVMSFNNQVITIGQKHNGSGGASLNQLLFDGSYLVGIQSTKAYEKITELAALKTDEALTEAILQVYSSIIIAEKTLSIYKENIKVLDKNLHDVTEIYKVGLGEEQTVEQMTYNRNIMKNSILNIQNVISILYQNLQFLLNVDSETPLKLTTHFDEILRQNTDLVDENNLENLNDHIDLRIAENQLLTDQLQLKYEKSKYLPTLAGFISTEYNAFSDQFDFFGRKWYNTSMWGLSLNIPIFSGLQRSAKVQQAQFKVTQSEVNQEKVSKQLYKNAKEGFLNFQNALLQYQLAEQQVSLSESIYNKENIKFFEGLGNSLDLTQAENQVFQAQAQLIQSVSEVVNKKIALDKALGNFNLTIQ